MKRTILIYSVMMLVLALSAYGLIDSMNSNSPPNDFYTNSQSPEFNFTVIGNSSTYNCTLYIDDSPNMTNELINNGSATILADDMVSEGSHTWYVNCTDDDGTDTTGPSTINIDITPPTVATVTVSDPLLTNSDTGNFYVNVDFNEDMNETILTNITFDPALSGELNPCIASWVNSTSTTYNCTIVDVNTTASDVNINVAQSRDLAGNLITSNISYSMFSMNQQEPILTIDFPIDGAYYNMSNLTLNFTVSGQEHCWYTLDGSTYSLTGCADTDLSELTDMTHSLMVFANDTVNNTVSDVISFTVDTTSPAVTSILSPNPANGYNISNGNSLFVNISTSEDLTEANISFDGGAQERMINSTELTSWSINKSDLSIGDHTYQITIWDYAYNSNSTIIYTFNATNITVDSSPPNTTNNADTVNWSRVFVITLSPTDETGIAYTSYRVGTLSWQNGTTIIINDSTNITSGNTIISYYSVDTIGNREDENNITVKYDVAAPISIIDGFKDDYSPYTFNEWSTDTALVNLTGDDDHSGYNRTIYCTDTTNTCSPSTEWSVTFNILTPGITYVRYRSVDNLNNTETIRINRVMILQNDTVYINESLNVTENETNIIVLENSTNSTIYVPPNVDATLDFSERINISTNTTRNVTLSGSINTTVNTTIIILFEIPEDVTLSGTSSWLGNFNLPKLMSSGTVTVVADSGYTPTTDIVVEIGADDVPILLDKAVRIKLTGKSDKILGFYRNGFVKITDICVNDTQEWADTNLSSDATGHCRITPENTTDLIIWTKHLSKFVTYTQTVTEDGDGGGGGGGSGSSSSGSSYVPSSNTTSNSTANPSVTYSYSLLESGTRIINVTHSQIPLYAMALTTTANVSNVRLKISLIENSQVAKIETVYKYFQIDHIEINDSIISGAKLQFKVAKSWLTENKIEKNQVVLYRYINGWNMLTTVLIKEDVDSIYYESSSPGLSVFAIATKPKPPVTVVEPNQNSDTEPSSTDNNSQDNTEDGNSLTPIIVSFIVIAMIVVLLYLFYAKKYKKKTNSKIDKK